MTSKNKARLNMQLLHPAKGLSKSKRSVLTSELLHAGSITLVMYLSLYFLEVEQGLSAKTQWVLGFVLLALIAGTCLWFLFNIFRRKEVLVALLKSTTITATRRFVQIKTLMKSDRLRSIVTRSTDRTKSNATLTSELTMSSQATLSPAATMTGHALDR